MADVYADEFFRAARENPTTHEEWLLRMHAQLMHREAEVVRVLERQARRRPPACRGSPESTTPPTATDATSSNES